MNTPCVTVADAAVKAGPDNAPLPCFRFHRRILAAWTSCASEKATATVREAIQSVLIGKPPSIGRVRQRDRVLQRTLAETARLRWNLAAAHPRAASKKEALTAADVLDARQGVTPGGCLDLFLIREEEAARLGLEVDLVHRAIKSREVGRWSVSWSGRVLLYPYCAVGRRAVPAFTLSAETANRLGILHALDFEKPLDAEEEEIVRRKGVNQATVERLLKHRIALGLVEHPATGET